MAKFRVLGSIAIGATLVVEADSADEAKEKAYQEWPHLDEYVGNGRRSGALIGTSERALTLSVWDNDPEFTDVEPADDYEDDDGA